MAAISAGTVSVSAVQRGNHVVIEVRDDGAGVDESRVREVATKRGLLTEHEAGQMSKRDLQNLVFLPGFSTAKKVSTLSGRGVGLDRSARGLGGEGEVNRCL